MMLSYTNYSTMQENMMLEPLKFRYKNGSRIPLW